MAILDILAQSGDTQDFILEIPAGNSGYIPADIVVENDGVLLCAEIPATEGEGGGNIFIMSE